MDVVMGAISYLLIIVAFGGYFVVKRWGDKQEKNALNEEAEGVRV